MTRLEELSATRHRNVEDGRFWQMFDPAGPICVGGIQTGEQIDRHAGTWP